VVGGDHAVTDGHEQVVASGGERCQGGMAGFHAYQCLGDGGVVEFAAGAVVTDGRDVNSGGQPGAPDDRISGVGGGAGDVGAIEGVAAGRHRLDVDIQRG